MDDLWSNDVNLIKKYVKEHKSDLNQLRWDKTPLMSAAKKGNIDCLQTLIDLGANVNFQNAYGVTALHEACYYDKIDAVAVLLQSDANPNIGTKFGDTCLHVLFEYNNGGKKVQIFYLLYPYITNFEVLNKDGQTPLMYAAAHGHKTFVEELLPYTKDINFADVDGRTALDFAKQFEYQNIVDILIAAGAEVN